MILLSFQILNTKVIFNAKKTKEIVKGTRDEEDCEAGISNPVKAAHAQHECPAMIGRERSEGDRTKCSTWMCRNINTTHCKHYMETSYEV